MIAAACAGVGLAAHADIVINVENAPGMALSVEQTPLAAEGEPIPAATVTLDRNGNAVFAQAPDPVMITLSANSTPVASRIISASGSEKINVSVDADGNVTVTGTPLAEGVARVDNLVAPYMARYRQLAQDYDSDPQGTEDAIEALSAEVNGALKRYVAENLDTPEAPYAVMMLDGEDFLEAMASLPPQTARSVLMPSLEQKRVGEERSVEAERRMAALENGSTPAPAFTLPDLAGKQVSLSDFKGKWVIIDFWGSWCRWCIKGFPELKEIAAKYADDLVIVGVDCRDSEERWRAAVEKYGLGWVNVYNDCSGETNPLLEAYAVQGFPTKVVVDPQGVIRKIVVGSDPRFPATLAEIMGK